MTAAYATALEVANTASAKFAAVTADYRAMKIGDAEFLAAQAEHKAACAAFDIAFEAESNLPEEVAEVEVVDDRQAPLF